MPPASSGVLLSCISAKSGKTLLVISLMERCVTIMYTAVVCVQTAAGFSLLLLSISPIPQYTHTHRKLTEEGFGQVLQYYLIASLL